MGTVNPAGALAAQIRRYISLHEVLPLYGVEPVECGVDDETRLQCHCPLPSHRRRKGKTFRIYSSGGTQHFPRWRCLSKTCAAGRAYAGNDVISFVALMEGCDLQTAAIKLAEWFAHEIAERMRQ